MTSPPPPSSEKQALIDAYDTVMQAEVERRNAPPERPKGKRTRPLAWIVLLLALAASGTVAAVRPEWLPFSAEPEESPALRDASLRLAIAMQAQRVARYRRSHALLPQRLEDAGAPLPGITYKVIGSDAFELHGINGPANLTYRSTEPIRTFVGNSYEVLKRRAP